MNTHILLAATLLLKFFIHWLLIGSHLLKPLNQHDSVDIVKTVLFYGFSITIVVIMLFFLTPTLSSPPANPYPLTPITMNHGAANDGTEQGYLVEATAKNLAQFSHTVNHLQRQESKTVHEALSALTMGNIAQAKAMFHSIIQAKQPLINEVATAYQHLGALAYWENTREALHAYQRAVELDPMNPLGWKQLGRLLLRTGRLAKAEHAFQQVLALSPADDPYTAMAYGNLGVIQLTRREWTQAESLFQQALELDMRNDDKYGMATDYGNLGNVYYYQGKYVEAEQMHNKALFLNQAIDNKKGIARDYNNLALLKAAVDDVKNAEKLHQKALAINLQIGHKEAIARDYLNLGVLYHLEGQLKKAITMYKRALENSEFMEDNETIALLSDNLGLVYYQQQELEQAQHFFQRAVDLYKGLRLPLQASRVCDHLRHTAVKLDTESVHTCQSANTALAAL